MIYFIGNEHGAIKIGHTTGLNGQYRLSSLQSANADQLTLLGHENGTIVDEGNLHAKFVSLRIRGEWFAAADDLLNYILSLPTTNRSDVQNWVATMLPNGNTADSQQLVGQIRINALNKAKNILKDANKQAKDTNKQAKDMVSKARNKAKSVLDEAKKQSQDMVLTDHVKQARINVLSDAKKQARNIIKAAKKQAQVIMRVAKQQAHVRGNQIIAEAEQKHKRIIDFAINCAASDIKALVADSCNPLLFDCYCCKCGRARPTVREREDGFPWCNPCWVNHAIFDGGRFDAIIAQANDAIQCEGGHKA